MDHRPVILRVSLAANTPAWLARAVEASFDVLRPRGVRLIVRGWSDVIRTSIQEPMRPVRDFRTFVHIHPDADDEPALQAEAMVWIALQVVQEFLLQTDDAPLGRPN